ncbi:MAG: RnfABCDGE type electron transport complex subunit D, partial [Planctomycetaceae bacterium]|nr:RnfABCDGE type electron transport complex subunit D [Planctomycetaceae bacterium]
MKPLRRLLDKLHHSFAKGGKYERFYPLYEATDTFLYTPGTVTKTASHVRDGMDMKRIMITVCVALIPCVFMAFWNTGYQANLLIHNRKQAERLLNANVIDSSEIGTVLQVSIGRTVDQQIDEITQELVKKHGQDYLASDEGRQTIESRTQSSKSKTREEVEQEVYKEYTGDIASGLKESLTSTLTASSEGSEVDLADTGYTPDWRGRMMESMGLKFDPTSFVSNLVFGGLFFLPVYIVCMAVGGIWETIFSVVRGHEINEGFLVTGLLFPLTLPPTIPLWQVALGISFGVVIGKEIFGGTGRNFLNPALTARAFLYFAYPAQSTGEGIWAAVSVDGFSGATTLGVMASAPVQEGLSATGITWWQAFSGTIQGSMGETSTLACIFGAIVLIGAG